MAEKATNMNTVDELAAVFRKALLAIGEDPARPGLLKTPERAAKAIMYFTQGYNQTAAGTILYLNPYYMQNI
jgi:GTP cyclohydrolase I